MKVAVLGLGRMGQAVAARLVDEGHHLIVWNRSPEKADALVERGAERAGNPSDAAASGEVVLTSLSNDDAVRALALDDDGVRSAVVDRIYADMSTVSPGLSAELGRAFDRFVAIPILGAPQAVRAGQAVYLAGGPESAVNALGPVLDSLGGPVKRYERPELASSAKLTVNLLLLSGVATLAEAITVGRRGGLRDDQLRDLFDASPMVAPGLRNRLDGVFAGSGDAWWTTSLGAKDAGLAVQLAESGGATLRLSPVVRQLYRDAVASGLRDEDIVAVAQLYR